MADRSLTHRATVAVSSASIADVAILTAASARATRLRKAETAESVRLALTSSESSREPSARTRRDLEGIAATARRESYRRYVRSGSGREAR